MNHLGGLKGVIWQITLIWHTMSPHMMTPYDGFIQGLKTCKTSEFMMLFQIPTSLIIRNCKMNSNFPLGTVRWSPLQKFRWQWILFCTSGEISIALFGRSYLHSHLHSHWEPSPDWVSRGRRFCIPGGNSVRHQVGILRVFDVENGHLH